MKPELVVLTVIVGQVIINNAVVTKAAARALENWARVGKERTYTLTYTDEAEGVEFRATLDRNAFHGMFETAKVEVEQ